jgi:hypothetical protein
MYLIASAGSLCLLAETPDNPKTPLILTSKPREATEPWLRDATSGYCGDQSWNCLGLLECTISLSLLNVSFCQEAQYQSLPSILDAKPPNDTWKRENAGLCARFAEGIGSERVGLWISNIPSVSQTPHARNNLMRLQRNQQHVAYLITIKCACSLGFDRPWSAIRSPDATLNAGYEIGQVLTA